MHPHTNQPLRLIRVADYQGQPAYRIETPAATYLYHRDGAGFASLIDPDGHDWISFRPFGGSDGRHRGIPNVIHPEGGFHPGADTCRSQIPRADPNTIVIASESNDGLWACQWDITPAHATLTLHRAAHPYWFLYEGTPGGHYAEADAFMIDSAGQRTACNQRWERRLPDPRWIYFGTPASRFILFVLDRTPRAPDVTDSFWSMQQSMTVFGLGRSLDSKGPRWKQLTETPAKVTIGLLPATADDQLAAQLNTLAEASPS